jgi:Aldo/keto reductase family
MLGACAGSGVRGVHSGLDPAGPARASRLTAAIRRAGRPPRFVIVAVRPQEENPPSHSARTYPPAEARSVGRPAAPEADAAVVVWEIVRTRQSVGGPTSSREDMLRSLPPDCPDRFGLGYDEPPGLDSLSRDLEFRPAWVRFPFHALSSPSTDELVRIARSAGVPVLASDPFASGRLDGSHLRGSPLESSGRPTPADWAEVRRTWAPVLALGFLTEGRRRKLPQAALQYVLGQPGIEGVVVPAIDPTALSEVVPSRDVPELSRGERQRVDELRSTPAGSPRPSAVSNLK